MPLIALVGMVDEAQLPLIQKFAANYKLAVLTSAEASATLQPSIPTMATLLGVSDGARPERLRSLNRRGIITIADVARVPVREFWRIIMAESELNKHALQIFCTILEVMRNHKVAFSDWDPGEQGPTVGEAFELPTTIGTTIKMLEVELVAHLREDDLCYLPLVSGRRIRALKDAGCSFAD